ncbi:spermidine synthase, partial [Candidatus Eisenbacteria bacterium]
TLSYWRNFYGVLRVEQRRMGESMIPTRTHFLLHGKTCHGLQPVPERARDQPTGYYTPRSGAGLAIRHHPRRTSPTGSAEEMRIGVLGLGVGTLAVYGREGDCLRFYEINPDVTMIARDLGLFTFLQDCDGDHDIVMGDARVSLERELRESGSQKFDVLVIDCFSGDAIPAHLLTKEAFELYVRHLRAPNSALAVHLTNEVLDLVPVVWQLASALGLDAAHVSAQGEPFGFPSDWMVLTPGSNYLRPVTEVDNAVWSDVGSRRVHLWTDDYHNLLEVLR